LVLLYYFTYIDDAGSNTNRVFVCRFAKMSNFMSALPVGAELILANRETDRDNEVDSHFSRILRTRLRTRLPWAAAGI